MPFLNKNKVILIDCNENEETTFFCKDKYIIKEKHKLPLEKKLELKSDEVMVLLGENWKKGAEQLEEKGYIVWKDFVPEWGFDFLRGENWFRFREIASFTDYNEKKMAEIFEYIAKYRSIWGVYGNCQSIVISKLMQNTNVLKEKYVFCEFPFVQDMKIEAEKGFHEDYMKFFSVFIYQNVSDKNNYGKKLATEDLVLKCLNKNCKTVSIPFVYFKGYFPQYIKNKRDSKLGLCPYGDRIIQDFCEMGKSTEWILERVKKEDLFSETEIQNNLDETIQELRRREEKCDIKILDWILENYQKQYLFYSPNHPTNMCFKELVRRILQYLGYQNLIIETEGIMKSDIIKCCIYPSVYKLLGLKFPMEKFRFHSKLGNEDTLEDYIKKYIEYNFPEFNDQMYQFFRTINMNDCLQLNKEKVSERMHGFFTISGRTMHLNLYLTVEAEVLNGVIMMLQKPQYAPRFGHIAALTVVPDGNTVPLFLNDKGEFKVNSALKKGTALILDTSWNIK